MLTCTFEDGDKAYLRHVVADGLIIRKNEILLVKRADFLLDGGKYALPGGYLDRDERVQDCVVREALEESGWECRVKRLFAIVDNPDRGDDRQNVGFIFLLEPLHQKQDADHEVSEVKWFSLHALPPSSQLAFDHEKIIRAYIDSLHKEVSLPLFI